MDSFEAFQKFLAMGFLLFLKRINIELALPRVKQSWYAEITSNLCEFSLIKIDFWIFDSGGNEWWPSPWMDSLWRKATQITKFSPIGGGCFNLASRYDTDAGSFFVKTNRYGMWCLSIENILPPSICWMGSWCLLITTVQRNKSLKLYIKDAKMLDQGCQTINV